MIAVELDAVKEFEIDQKTPTQFVIDLGAKVDKIGAVEVIKLIPTSRDVYEVPVTLKGVTHKDDKVTVDLYTAVSDKSNYIVKVDGYEDYTWTAYNGKPYEIILSGKADALSPYVTAAGERDIHVTIYDENGVNITNDTYKSKIVYNVKEYSADGSYYVTENGKVYFAKAELSAVVTAEYVSGEFDDNGNPVGNVPAEMEFVSVDAAPVKIETVTGTLYDINKQKDTKGLTVPYGDSVRLDVKIKTSDVQDAVAIVPGVTPVNGGTISFETASPNVAAIDSDMNLYLFKEGTATILVNWTVVDASGNSKTEPIAALPVTITEARKLTNLSLSSSNVIVGTEVGFHTESLTINAKDRYGDEVDVTDVEITGVNALAKEVVAGIGENNTKNITLDGTVLGAALKNGATAVQLNYTVKVNKTMTTNLTVLVKAKGAVGATQTGFAITDGKFDNVERNVDSTAVKSVTITAYKMNNGIKVGYTNIDKAPEDIKKDAVVGNYYVKVKKNNVDVTANSSITVSGSAIKINFTADKTLENGYKVVDYGLGAGTYVVELYKCAEQGGNKVLAKQNATLTGTATKSGATYSAATRTAEEADVTTLGDVDAALRAIFKVNNTKNVEATSVYTVDYLGKAEAGYVYVNSFTFYDDLGDGTYAEYTVPVNTSVKVK